VPKLHDIYLPSREELLGLIPLLPPHGDVGLDAIKGLERSIEIERIELVARHSVSQQGELDGSARVLVERASAGKLLHIPEVRQRRGTLPGGIFRRVVDDLVAECHEPQAILMDLL